MGGGACGTVAVERCCCAGERIYTTLKKTATSFRGGVGRSGRVGSGRGLVSPVTHVRTAKERPILLSVFVTIVFLVVAAGNIFVYLGVGGVWEAGRGGNGFQ